jgi:hypothetical protein
MSKDRRYKILEISLDGLGMILSQLEGWPPDGEVGQIEVDMSRDILRVQVHSIWFHDVPERAVAEIFQVTIHSRPVS